MSSLLFEQYRYAISDIELENPPASSFPWRKPTFVIEISKVTGNDHERLESAVGNRKNNRVVWSEQILYNVTTESTITFKILKKKGKADDLVVLIIGEYTNTVSSLLLMQRSAGVCKVRLGKQSQLSFTIKEDRFKDLLDDAKRQSEGIYFTQGVSWSTFLTYFDLVKTAADSVSSLHPYGHQAWSILSIVPNILQMHATRNKNVQNLFERLTYIYKYINEADRLSALTDTQSDELKLLIVTTCECVDFIKKYTDNSAGTNLMKGVGFDSKISKFKDSFDQILKTVQEFLTLQIGITTLNSDDFNRLGDIPYADNVGIDHSKMCLHGTREKLIKEIVEWIYQADTSARVLILSGQAGTGKSAVAHTVAKKMGDKLGSFFCFNRSNKGKINLLFSTISRNLADRHVLWKRNLVQAVQDIAIRKSLDLQTQFDEMIIKPSKGTTKRMIIIIDALDESGDQKERKILLPLLFERSSELPSNIRIIITSRPEHDIKVFHQHRNVCCKYMTDVNPTDTLNDIQQVISHELSDISETLNTVDNNWCSLLAQRAQRLFIWAKIACDYILYPDELEAAQRLRSVLTKSTSSLYEMYHQVLDAQPGCHFDSHLILLKKCVGAIMCSRKPFSISDLQAFFGPDCGDSKNVQVVLKLLNSLFIGLDGQSTTHIRPIHTSVFDFFLSSDQMPGTQNRYYIDTSDQSYFTHACLRVMNGMLRFNICELETSHKRNRDVPDFGSRVAKAIPSSLSYACCFWAYHLEYSSLNEDLLAEINDLIRIKLLYLFEVLSLLAEVDHGRSGMQIVINMTKDTDPELASLAEEASQFLFKFGMIMTRSTPHLYLSALPYISKESFISSQYLPQYPHLFSVDVGQPISLRPQIKNSVTQRHPSSHPRELAFSPQNTQIAAGFYNGDLWVWDYITGEILCQMSPEEEARITDIIFSLNGELVYCCYTHGGILIWEENTRNVSYESNERIAPEGCHFCCISPDGRFIAFKTDKTVICYERETCVKPFEDILADFRQLSSAVMFSSRGRFVGIQPNEEVLRLWDTREKTFVLFASFTKHHRLVALSDNHIIVRSSKIGDNKVYDIIEVYDIQTTMVCLFQKHTPLWTAGFSPNGEDLFLSHENECLIRNVSTGKELRRHHPAFRHRRIGALSSNATHIAVEYGDAIHVLAWDDLDQEEIDNRSEDKDIIYEVDQAGAWHKGQHVILRIKPYNIFIPQPGPADLRVLDPAGTAVLKCAPVLVNHRPLAEVSPEDNHWTIAYVDISRPSSLCLWNIDEKEIFTIDESDKRLTILVFSPSGDRLLSCDEKDNIKVWDVRTRTLSSCSRVSSTVMALTFSQTGATFWVAYQTDEHGFVEERDSESHKTINGPFPHDLCIRPSFSMGRLTDPYAHSIFVSSNDTYICVCFGSWSRDGSIACSKSWGEDIINLDILDRSTGASINCSNTRKLPAFSPNRKYIAWIPLEDPKKVKLWDMEKGIPLDGPPSDNQVKMIRFSNDSERICALVGSDGMCRVTIWDIQTKTMVMQCLSPGPWPMEPYSMALDGDSLLTVGGYGIAKVWDLRVYEIMTRLCSDHINDPQFADKFGHLQTRRLIEDYKLRSEDSEVLDSALTAWNNASFSPWTKQDENGWMLGPHGELLFWIPWKMQMNLWYPSMWLMRCYKNFTKLGFENFVHGTRWTECKK